MPVVTVTALGADRDVVERLLVRLAEGVAEGVSCPVGDVWCSFVPASAQSIGERLATSGEQCPIVVIRARVRAEERVAAGMRAAAHLATRGDVLAVLGVGSAGAEHDGLDEHSDLDFFVQSFAVDRVISLLRLTNPNPHHRRDPFEPSRRVEQAYAPDMPPLARMAPGYERNREAAAFTLT